VDAAGWYVATMHQLLGHEKAAAAMGVPAGDKSECAFEADPTPERRQAVIDAIGSP
jgi:hypothetical protein